MAAPIIGLVISAISKVSPGLASALGSIKNFADSAIGLIKGIFKWTAGIVGSIAGTLGYFVKGFLDGEKAAFNLDMALKKVGNSMGYTKQKTQEVISKLEKLTTLDDEALTNIVSSLINTGKINPSKIEEATTLVADFIAMGYDQVIAAKMVARSYIDIGEAVTLLDSKMSGFDATQEKAIKEMINLNDEAELQKVWFEQVAKVQGRAAEEAQSTYGKYLNLIKTMGKLRQAIGATIYDTLDLETKFEKMSKTIDGIIKDPKEIKKWMQENLKVVNSFLKTTQSLFDYLAEPNEIKLKILKDDFEQFKADLKKAISDAIQFVGRVIVDSGIAFEIGLAVGKGIAGGIKQAITEVKTGLITKGISGVTGKPEEQIRKSVESKMPDIEKFWKTPNILTPVNDPIGKGTAAIRLLGLDEAALSIKELIFGIDKLEPTLKLQRKMNPDINNGNAPVSDNTSIDNTQQIVDAVNAVRDSVDGLKAV